MSSMGAEIPRLGDTFRSLDFGDTKSASSEQPRFHAGYRGRGPRAAVLRRWWPTIGTVGASPCSGLAHPPPSPV